MTDLRTAAKAALWAFQYHVEQTWPTDRSTAAITALRAALAQPAEPVQEPVAWLIAQRDALLELVVEMDQHEGAEGWSEDLRVKIDAAIKAVEETK